MENNEIAQAISNLNLGLFSYKSYYPKYNAQENLRGRTHFVDDDTMKFFGSRISRTGDSCSGLLFYVIHSSYLNFEKTKRGFRYAVFDLFGNEVARQTLDEALSTSEKAHKAMYNKISTLDIADHYRQALQSVIRQSARKTETAQEVLAKIGG